MSDEMKKAFYEARERMHAFVEGFRESEHVQVFVLIGSPADGNLSAGFTMPPDILPRVIADALKNIPTQYKEKGPPS